VIDVNTGKVTKTYEIEGAEFLNDITVDEKGNVYISDSATGKIHRLSGNKVGMYFQSPDFKRVNGLLALKNSLYIADAGNGINYKLSIEKELTKFTETAPGADGVVQVEENLFIVSSWGGEVYYVDASAKAQKLLDTKEQKLNSADVDYDSKSRTLFVPTFFGNKVMAYTFEK
ncbi:MAG: ATP/GTP-binding protein, partial [Bacteroidota bacterium]